MHLETLKYTNTEHFCLPQQNANHFEKDIHSKQCMQITKQWVSDYKKYSISKQHL